MPKITITYELDQYEDSDQITQLHNLSKYVAFYDEVWGWAREVRKYGRKLPETSEELDAVLRDFDRLRD